MGDIHGGPSASIKKNTAGNWTRYNKFDPGARREVKGMQHTGFDRELARL